MNFTRLADVGDVTQRPSHWLKAVTSWIEHVTSLVQPCPYRTAQYTALPYTLALPARTLSIAVSDGGDCISPRAFAVNFILSRSLSPQLCRSLKLSQR